MRRLTAAVAAVGLWSLIAAVTAFAGPPAGPTSDNLSSPLQSQQAALVQKGLALKASGAIGADASSVKVSRGAKAKYVQLAQTGHSDIFVILAQFGNTISSLGGTPGPLANQIPKPDRTVDNSTIWFDGGYSPLHYQQLYFDHTPGANSVTNYYQLESSGRFNFDGAATTHRNPPAARARARPKPVGPAS